MITGVLTILIAETFLFQSVAILVWALLFFGINSVYFILKEESDLVKRFGAEYTEYTEYKKHVPRWIPRVKGWRPKRIEFTLLTT